MKRTISDGRLLAALALGATLSATVAFSQTPMFSLKVLANLPGETQAGAYAINNAGEVVGFVGGSSVCPTGCAVTWSGGAPTRLGAVAGATSTSAIGINNAGQICGYAELGAGGASTAVMWNHGRPTTLPGNAPFIDESIATDVNDAGQVVGYAADYAIEWNGKTPLVLGMGGSIQAGAWGINNPGLIVGDVHNTPAIWRGTIPTHLPTISGNGGGRAVAVNDSELMVGTSTDNEGVPHASAWINGRVTDLGSLHAGSSAAAVNNLGIIVGTAKRQTAGDRAVFWSSVGAQIQDLNDLIAATAASEVVLTGASAINDHCSIVAQGYARQTKVNQALLLILNDPSKCVNGL